MAESQKKSTFPQNTHQIRECKMKRILKMFIAFVLLTTPIFWLNCDGDNPAAIDLNDPSTFPGTYDLVSLTDKGGDFGVPDATFTAGEPLQLFFQGVPILTITITGSLVLTETKYTITQSVEIAGGGTETETDTGTYFISGSTSSAISDDGGTETFTISVSGNRLTLENDEIKFVFEKQ